MMWKVSVFLLLFGLCYWKKLGLKISVLLVITILLPKILNEIESSLSITWKREEIEVIEQENTGFASRQMND